ncbi:hypothetical protein FYJ43_03395 [Cutibacterium sp. WCA-380-WT-3A]|uniref:DUF5808 domain-containing protein n=1 Tax=Cutibacterium porci TaxID=2605781 RepID=A0A7K0J590_9ACTN|nr:DUF5808 domain-containing protein [Cutibacterium porci]MSS45111.1 hypothetical protein [Cutibacterium porci]
MAWFTKGDDDRTYIFGLPLSKLWEGDANALLDTFEPENPHLFVPRSYGLGWTINFGKIAVKAGWIRPDDSIPDLVDFIPDSVRRSIVLAQVAGNVALIASAAQVARHDFVATGWSLGGLPKRYSRGKNLALAMILTAGVLTALPSVVRCHEAESHEAIKLSYHADQLGFTSASVVGLVAANRSAGASNQRQFVAVVAPFLGLLVSGGVKLTCVKTALRNLNKQLRAGVVGDGGIGEQQ